MLRRSHLFQGITSTSTFWGVNVSLLKETTHRPGPRIEPGSPEPESDALTTRPVRPLFAYAKCWFSQEAAQMIKSYNEINIPSQSAHRGQPGLCRTLS